MAILRICGLSILLTALTLSGGCISWKRRGDAQAPDSGTTVFAPASASTSANWGAPGAGRLSNIARAYQAGLGAGNNVVHFDADSDALSGPGITLLERHAAFIKANPGVTVRLEGHADERGSLEDNVTLGRRRVQAVAAFLQASGVDARQIRMISCGRLMPLIDSNDETARAQNRRVEIVYH